MVKLSKIDKRVLRLLSALRDLEYTDEAMKFFLGTSSSELRYHLFVSMVVAYCRPFTENEGVGSLKIEYLSYPDYPDQEMNIRHDRMVSIRHQFLAHSSLMGTKCVISSTLHPVANSGVIEEHFNYSIARRDFTKESYVTWLFDVCEALRLRIHNDLPKVLAENYSKGKGLKVPIILNTDIDMFNWTK